MSNNIPVCIAIPTLNEEANLAKCLERLARFEDIVIIDSGSSDNTCQIAESYGARVVNFNWDGKYPKKRNWFLTNHAPKQPWVLFLDADEFMSDKFCDVLADKINDADKNGVSGYWLQYTNYFLGKELRHGLTQRKLALFRVGAALYERIQEDGWSKLDMEIHEHPIVDGRLGSIDVPLDHRDYKGLARFLEKHCDYARWEAKRYNALQADPDAAEHFTSRQKFKYRHLAKWWYASFYFVFTYFVRLGILDGPAGFQYAAYKVWYFNTIRLLIREQQSGIKHIS